MGVSNKTPEFLKMNPFGKVPVLETPDGPVFESNAIAQYVTRLKADNPLYGSSLIEYALVEQWIDFATLEIDANILRWFMPRIGFAVYLPPAEGAAISSLKRALTAQEEEAPKPKAKNPLDLLPPIWMNGKGFIQTQRPTSVRLRSKGFWDMYDPEGYSLWFCDYNTTMKIQFHL